MTLVLESSIMRGMDLTLLCLHMAKRVLESLGLLLDMEQTKVSIIVFIFCMIDRTQLNVYP